MQFKWSLYTHGILDLCFKKIRFGKTLCIHKMMFLFYISTGYVAIPPIRRLCDLIIRMFSARGWIFYYHAHGSAWLLFNSVTSRFFIF